MCFGIDESSTISRALTLEMTGVFLGVSVGENWVFQEQGVFLVSKSKYCIDQWKRANRGMEELLLSPKLQ